MSMSIASEPACTRHQRRDIMPCHAVCRASQCHAIHTYSTHALRLGTFTQPYPTPGIQLPANYRPTWASDSVAGPSDINARALCLSVCLECECRNIKTGAAARGTAGGGTRDQPFCPSSRIIVQASRQDPFAHIEYIHTHNSTVQPIHIAYLPGIVGSSKRTLRVSQFTFAPFFFDWHAATHALSRSFFRACIRTREHTSHQRKKSLSRTMSSSS